MSERECRESILASVREYARQYHRPPGGDGGGRIPYAGRVYDEDDVATLVDAALDFWLTAGRFTRAFERDFARWLGVRHASVVNSGSSANLLALAALTAPELGQRRLRPGDEVITAAAAFPTTVAPILQCGAVPVFVDITVPQCNIDAGRLESALSGRTRAVVVAHALGNPFDLESVRDFCDRHGLWLVEDNCDALGSTATVHGQTRLTGTVGDLATHSFYPAHHLTMGEGGCVCTDDDLLHRLVRSYRDWGRDCQCPPGVDGSCGHRFDGLRGQLPPGYDHKYVYSHWGYNLKATDLQAAVGCAQLRKLPGFIAARRRNWRRLREALRPAERCLLLPEPLPGSDPSWFGFLITVNTARFTRTELVRHLESCGVQTRLLFAGNLTRQPCFDEMRARRSGYRVAGDLDQTDRVLRDSFWIGVYPGMTPAMIDRMADSILGFCGAR